MIELQAWAAKNVTRLTIYAAVLLLWVGSLFGSYFYGKAVQRTDFAKAEAVVLKGELDDAQKDGELNAKRAEKTGAEVALMDARLEAAIGELNEAIAKASRSTSCDLTDYELRALQALRDSYQQ